jgi:hypothetical protein
MPMPRPIRPNSNPPGIIQKRVSKKSRRRIEIVTNQVPNLHRSAASSRKMLTPREQGDFGELSAMQWLAWQGASVARPVGNNRHWDVMAEFNGRAIRVQVKTSRCVNKDRWAVTLATRGGNQSWNGLTKYLDPSRFDYLFVLVGDGRRWFIPRVGSRAAVGWPWVARSTPNSRSSQGIRSPAAPSK